MPTRKAPPAKMNGRYSFQREEPVLREYQMNSTEKARPTTAIPTSRTTRGVCSVRPSASRHLICAAAENPYGMAAVMPDMKTRVLNTVIPTEPAYDRIMKIDASTVDEMMPKRGTPRSLSLPKASGNRPSLAAASGISAQIIVQPLRAPKPEMTTRADITYPAHVPPKISLTAVANGAVDLFRAAAETMPNTAVSDSRYTTA